MKLNVLLLAMLATALFSCNSKIVSEKDYTQYLKPISINTEAEHLNADELFWKKRLEENKGDMAAQIKLASVYSHQFKTTGNIEKLHSSDSLYQLANKIQGKFGSSIYRSLAANAVTQHQFKKALSYIDSALVLGDDKYVTKLLQVDITMELGNLWLAQNAMNDLKDKNSFEYLIREAKLNDKKGNLDEAVISMEKAFDKIKDGSNQPLIEWTMTNLADMYGHQNKIEKSYSFYLQALQRNPYDFHALKGIAWIAFSNDNNTKAAKEILNYLQKNHPIPDYDLMLAQISEVENNLTEKQIYLKNFISKSKLNLYGEMYNRYQFYVFANDLNNITEAETIANKEVDNRAVPESFTLLAWSKYKKGNYTEATEIAKEHILNKTEEPLSIYSVGEFFRAVNDKANAKKYLQQALESSFELGPVITKQIKESLKNI